MSKEPTLDDLEQALMDRARRLADEYLARAESTRERMLRDENEHLRVREEREVLAAELEAWAAMRVPTTNSTRTTTLQTR